MVDGTEVCAQRFPPVEFASAQQLGSQRSVCFSVGVYGGEQRRYATTLTESWMLPGTCGSNRVYWRCWHVVVVASSANPLLLSVWKSHASLPPGPCVSESQ